MTTSTPTTPGPSAAARARGGATRQRILDAALRHFAENGYAGTSIRDLADELGVTKAAVHYHFAAKDRIVLALMEPMLQQFAEHVEQHAAAGDPPRELLLRVREVLVVSGPLLSVLSKDPSLGEPGGPLQTQVHALAARTAEVLAGPAADAHRLLRAHCALGAFFAGWDTCLSSRGVRTVDGPALEVLLTAALAALGEDPG